MSPRVLSRSYRHPPGGIRCKERHTRTGRAEVAVLGRAHRPCSFMKLISGRYGVGAQNEAWGTAHPINPVIGDINPIYGSCKCVARQKFHLAGFWCYFGPLEPMSCGPFDVRMTDSRKRLFFALWPDPVLADEICKSTQKLVHNTQGRPVSPERMHVTLAFLHNVDAARLPAVAAAAHTIESSPFDLILRRIGYWYRSRILWLGPGSQTDQEAAGQLAQAVWTALAPIGFTPERRPFRAHVTLARKAHPPESLTQEIDPVCWRTREFALVESLTGRRPAGYRVLETFALSS